jgi:hypothetical protein
VRCRPGAIAEPVRVLRRLGPMHRAPGSRSLSLAVLVCALAVASCAAVPGSQPRPRPVCGGIKIAIPGALSCDQITSIALNRLVQVSPEQMARGVSSIEVALSECPRGEMPPMIDCTGEQHAQMVTVNFVGGNPKLDSLTVAVGPVSGRILGISNPLIR